MKNMLLGLGVAAFAAGLMVLGVLIGAYTCSTDEEPTPLFVDRETNAGWYWYVRNHSKDFPLIYARIIEDGVVMESERMEMENAVDARRLEAERGEVVEDREIVKNIIRNGLGD